MKTVIITGGNRGLGYECAKNIAAETDWHVILACRNIHTAQSAVKQLVTETSNPHIEAMTLDLASLASVRQFTQAFAARNLPPLKALVCNAGLQVVSGTTFTQDGFEMTFGVNHLGHYLLTHLLLGQLDRPARIVVVSSGTHDPTMKTGLPHPKYTDGHSLAFPKQAESTQANVATIGRQRYTTSKLCNVYMTYELVRQLQAANIDGITVNAFDPGMMPGTGLARDYNPIIRFVWRFILPGLTLFRQRVNTTSQSGAALARLVTDSQLSQVTGKYFEGMEPIRSSDESYDEARALELWQSSAQLVKLTASETIFNNQPQHSQI